MHKLRRILELCNLTKVNRYTKYLVEIKMNVNCKMTINYNNGKFIPS